MLSMEKRAEMFEAKLSEYDLITLSYICKRDVENEANKIADRQMFAVNQALDTSISAAIYELTDLSIRQVEEIISKSSDYMKDCEEFLIKYKEDWVMEINKIKPDIKKECLKLLDKNINGQNEAVKELKIKFKTVPNKDLANIFQEAKEEWVKPIEMRKELETKNKPISDTKKPTNNISQETKKESVEKVREGKNKLLKPKFPFPLEGDNGRDYTVTKEYVQYEDYKFKNLQDLEEYQKEFERHIAEIKEAFSYM